MRSLFVGLSVIVLAGCGASTPEDSIRRLLPEAASIRNVDFEALSGWKRIGPAPVKNQSLSMVLLGLNPAEEVATRPQVVADFAYDGNRPPKPNELLEAIWLSRSRGYASLIQPGFIQTYECQFAGGKASGVVAFKAPGLYAGKAEFSASIGSLGWQIDEFRLPNYGLKVTRGADGLWARSSLEPTPAPGPQATPPAP